MRVLEKRVLRKIFGAETDKVTDDSGRRHYEGLHHTYCSPNVTGIIK